MVSTFSWPPNDERPEGGAHFFGRRDANRDRPPFAGPLEGFFFRRACERKCAVSQQWWMVAETSHGANDSYLCNGELCFIPDNERGCIPEPTRRQPHVW